MPVVSGRNQGTSADSRTRQGSADRRKRDCGTVQGVKVAGVSDPAEPSGHATASATTATKGSACSDGDFHVSQAGTAPILVGEFGAKNVGTDTVEGRWIRQFADYMGRTGISWTFWAWNPNSGDTGGVLQDDWNTVNAAKMPASAIIARRSISELNDSYPPT